MNFGRSQDNIAKLRTAATKAAQKGVNFEPKPMSDADWAQYQWLLDGAALIPADPNRHGHTVFHHCFDALRCTEAQGHFRTLAGEEAIVFPDFEPGGPLLAHPEVCDYFGHCFFDGLIIKLMLAVKLSGLSSYTPVGHARCGLAADLGMDFTEVVEKTVELGERVTETMKKVSPLWVSNPMIHVDRLNRCGPRSQRMATYDVNIEVLNAMRKHQFMARSHGA